MGPLILLSLPFIVWGLVYCANVMRRLTPEDSYRYSFWPADFIWLLTYLRFTAFGWPPVDEGSDMDYGNPDLPAEVAGDAQLDGPETTWMDPETAAKIAADDAVIAAHLAEQDALDEDDKPGPHDMYAGIHQPNDGKARCRCGLVFDTVILWMEHSEAYDEAEREAEWMREQEAAHDEDLEPDFKG